MAINQNHLFEDLNGVKCAVVEKNVGAARVDFLRKILEYNRYTVVVVPSPPPKAAAGASGAAAAGAAASVGGAAAGPVGAAGSAAGPVGASDVAAAGAAGSPAPVVAAPAPETFTVGVTDMMFNAVNAVFGRLLKTPGGQVVTLAFWKQQENEPDDEKPYFDGGR